MSQELDILKPIEDLSYEQLRAAYRLHRDRVIAINARMREIEEAVPKHYVNQHYAKARPLTECASPHQSE